MSAPNEPGHPGSGERSTNGTNGSGDRPAGDFPRSGPVSTTGSDRRYSDTTETPPWQRGPAGRNQTPQGQRPPTEPSQRPAGAAPEAGNRHSPAADARLNRFVSGASSTTGNAPAPNNTAPKATTPVSEQQDVVPVPREAYASELPDLSGPAPRPASLRKPTPERQASEPAAPAATRASTRAGRVQASSRSRKDGPVRASMQIRRVDPWSALKVALVLSIALFFIWMIAVAFLYLTLGGMGVWTKLNSNVGDLLTNGSSGDLVSASAIFGGAAMIGLVNIVLLTAGATIGAFIYNLTTDLVGGVEVTLADRD